jgi:hypothetical protein
VYLYAVREGVCLRITVDGHIPSQQESW